MPRKQDATMFGRTSKLVIVGIIRAWVMVLHLNELIKTIKKQDLRDLYKDPDVVGLSEAHVLCWEETSVLWRFLENKAQLGWKIKRENAVQFVEKCLDFTMDWHQWKAVVQETKNYLYLNGPNGMET